MFQSANGFVPGDEMQEAVLRAHYVEGLPMAEVCRQYNISEFEFRLCLRMQAELRNPKNMEAPIAADQSGNSTLPEEDLKLVYAEIAELKQEIRALQRQEQELRKKSRKKQATIDESTETIVDLICQVMQQRTSRGS